MPYSSHIVLWMTAATALCLFRHSVRASSRHADSMSVTVSSADLHNLQAGSFVVCSTLVWCCLVYRACLSVTLSTCFAYCLCSSLFFNVFNTLVVHQSLQTFLVSGGMTVPLESHTVFSWGSESFFLHRYSSKHCFSSCMVAFTFSVLIHLSVEVGTIYGYQILGAGPCTCSVFSWFFC
jgi:hypothetical protein